MTTEDISIEYQDLTVQLVKVTLTLEEWGALLDTLETAGLGDLKSQGYTLTIGNHLFVLQESLQ